MEFTAKERLILLNVLPAEGDLLSLRLVRKLREALSFSEEEHSVFEFVQIGDQVRYNAAAMAGAPAKEIEVGPRMVEMVAKAFQAIADNPHLTMDHLTLYERFVPESETDTAA